MLIGGLWLGAPAYGCDYAGPATPSLETRVYRHPQLGFSFDIPANYRAMGTRLGTVEFHDPATFSHIQCLVNTQSFPQLPPGTTLEVRPAMATADLITQVQRILPWLVLHRPSYEQVTAGLGQAVIFRYTHHIHGTEMKSLTFLSADQSFLITLESPAGAAVIPLVLETLRL